MSRTSFIFESVLAPALAAQLFVVVLIYLLVLRKRMTNGYRLYALFLITWIFLVGGRAAQFFFSTEITWYINYSRVSLFMAIGIPALFIVSARQAGVVIRKKVGIGLFGFGLLLALMYVAAQNLRLGRGIFVFPVPFNVTMLHVNVSWWIATVGLLALPNIFFIFREWTRARNPTHIAFMGGAALFGILMAVGAFLEWAALYYLGSMICALLWFWAMFEHVRKMKGRTGILIEELEGMVQSGALLNPEELEAKLAELELLSIGDVSLYKLRIREILVVLTEVTIRAGGDSSELIERTEARERQISQTEDPQQIREMLRDEAIELSEIVSEVQRESPLVCRAREFMEQTYQEDLSVDEIADHLGVSRSYFMREFKRGTGKTANQYLTTLRIDKAKDLLLGSRTVTEVAFEVGFNHSNYFSTVFKKYTGMTPVEYQKTHGA